MDLKTLRLAFLLVTCVASVGIAEDGPGGEFFDKDELNKGFFTDDQSPGVPKRGGTSYHPNRDWRKAYEDPEKFMRDHPDFYIPDVTKMKVPTPNPDFAPTEAPSPEAQAPEVTPTPAPTPVSRKPVKI